MSQAPTRGPIRLFYSYSHRDEHLRDDLETHLSLLRKQGVIAPWHDRRIGAGMEWAASIDQYLESADVILLLVSADFLASDYCYDVEMRRAMQRHESDEARVIPLILRPVDWHSAPFGKLQALPRDGKPVTTWENVDEAWLEITRAIRLVCDEIQEEARFKASATFPSSADNSVQTAPTDARQLYEVFVKSGVPTVTFVEREDFPALKLALAQPGRGIVLEGPSGIGKTTTLKKAFEQVQSDSHSKNPQHTEFDMLSARNPEHRQRIETLPHWHSGTVVVDDFHRLSPNTRQMLVDYLKYLADIEPVAKKLVIIGIPQSGRMLVDLSFDLATRIDIFDIGKVSNDLIVQMIGQGERALNIEFDRRLEIALAAAGSFNIAQYLCYQICLNANITQTQSLPGLVKSNLETAVSGVMQVLNLRFGEAVRRFSSLGGPADRTTIDLLERLAQTPDGYLSLRPLLETASPLGQQVQELFSGDSIAALYRDYPNIANFLHMDVDIPALVADDPQLKFFLSKTSMARLAREVGKVTQLSTRASVFISYAHGDKAYVDRLRIHLQALENLGAISAWDDTRLRAGSRWEDEMRDAIERAQVAVLFISTGYFASPFVREFEVLSLLDRAAKNGTRIVPVLISPIDLRNSPIAHFQMLNPTPLEVLSPTKREVELARLAALINRTIAPLAAE